MAFPGGLPVEPELLFDDTGTGPDGWPLVVYDNPGFDVQGSSVARTITKSSKRLLVFDG
jgi:hypothetical protein